MNYNYNQYSQYPYAYQQQTQYNQYQPQYQPQQQQTQYIPLTFVSGIEGAKAFIVAPNQTVYLRDSDSDTIYIKSANAQGRYEMKSYILIPSEEQRKLDTSNYVQKGDFNAYIQGIEERLGELEKNVLKAPKIGE